ncbi:MAG TPA: FmdB family zinc ribbon protein [Acidimicrobiales bacterium]
MPTYEYRCKDCGQDLEVQQAFTDDPLTECPSCRGALKKKFGSVGISFKGAGFYKNDSRGSGTKTSTTAAAGTDSKDSSSESTSTSESSSSQDSKDSSSSTSSSSNGSSSTTAAASA